MFVYSLDGLKIDSEAPQDVEIEENETTARAGVYHELARLFAVPDRDAHAVATGGEWSERLTEAAELLAYSFDFGSPLTADAVSADEFEKEYRRLFDVDGDDGPAAPLYSGGYGDGDRKQNLERAQGAYQYFGLSTSAEDPRPADHLCTQLEFMQYLAFKEAASASPRLSASFRRAQEDCLEAQLEPWLPEFALRVKSLEPMPYWEWAASTVAAFVAADAGHLRQSAR